MLFIGCGGVSIDKYESVLTAKSECHSELASLQSKCGSCPDELASCRQTASSSSSSSADDTPEASIALVDGYLNKMGVGHQVVDENTIVITDTTGTNKRFKVYIRYFKKVEVLYLVADDYITLPNIGTADDMTKACLLLSKAMDINYQLTIGKLEFNTKSGGLKYSVVINSDDGVGYKTFKATYQSLVSSADKKYAELADFMRENGYPID
jgi:hypothetical protein